MNSILLKYIPSFSVWMLEVESDPIGGLWHYTSHSSNHTVSLCALWQIICRHYGSQMYSGSPPHTCLFICANFLYTTVHSFAVPHTHHEVVAEACRRQPVTITSRQTAKVCRSIEALLLLANVNALLL